MKNSVILVLLTMLATILLAVILDSNRVYLGEVYADYRERRGLDTEIYIVYSESIPVDDIWENTNVDSAAVKAAQQYDLMKFVDRDFDYEQELEEEETEDEEVSIPEDQIQIVEVDYTLYVSVKTLNVREEPNTECDIISITKLNEKVRVIGELKDNSDWVEISHNGVVGWVYAKYTSDKPKTAKNTTQIRSGSKWERPYAGDVLTKDKGAITGPMNGKETYYNLDMSHIVARMGRLGFSGEEWEYHVREDGVKMLGNYVMVAANLKIYPRGSFVETSLGPGIVCDTGGFVEWEPTGIDIATNW